MLSTNFFEFLIHQHSLLLAFIFFLSSTYDFFLLCMHLVFPLKTFNSNSFTFLDSRNSCVRQKYQFSLSFPIKKVFLFFQTNLFSKLLIVWTKLISYLFFLSKFPKRTFLIQQFSNEKIQLNFTLSCQFLCILSLL